MLINDVVYGKIQITDPVLLDLISAKPLQRLKKVNQAGTQLVFPHLKTTRFDHSAGVMILLKIKGASLEEQIAGLLHDVSHTAFSHAMDYAFGKETTGDYHELFLKKVVFKSEIPEILIKYGFNASKVTTESSFKLLERPVPKLCADRIDYTLRDLITDRVISKKQAKNFLDNIIVYKGEFVMKDKKMAKEFAIKYFTQSDKSWISAKTLATFNLLVIAIKRGIAQNLLSKDDIFRTDNHILKKLRKSNDPQISKILSLLNPKFEVVDSPKNFHFHLTGKIRYIDPPVLVNNKLKRLSKIDPKFAEVLKDYIKRMQRGRYIKISDSGGLALK